MWSARKSKHVECDEHSVNHHWIQSNTCWLDVDYIIFVCLTVTRSQPLCWRRRFGDGLCPMGIGGVLVTLHMFQFSRRPHHVPSGWMVCICRTNHLGGRRIVVVCVLCVLSCETYFVATLTITVRRCVWYICIYIRIYTCTRSRMCGVGRSAPTRSQMNESCTCANQCNGRSNSLCGTDRLLFYADYAVLLCET